MTPSTLVDDVSAEAVVRLTQALVRIPSQYSEELVQHRDCAQFLADHCRSIGYDVAVAEAVENYPAVIATLRGTNAGPTVGVIGHYSVMPVGDLSHWTVDPFGGEVRDGRIYGRGAADQKGGIAAVLVAAEALARAGRSIRGTLKLLLVPGEGCTEMAMQPITRDTPELVRADYYLDSDGEPGHVTIAHGGFVWLRLTTEGVAGHPGIVNADGRPPLNAVAKMIEVLHAMRTEPWMAYEPHPLFSPEHDRYATSPIIEVDRIAGGHKVNAVPDACVADVDIRLLPSQTAEGVTAELDRLLDRLRGADPTLRVAWKPIAISVNRRMAEPDHPAVRAIQQTFATMGLPIPRVTGSVGGGRQSLSQFGPVIHCGACGGSGAHAPDESTALEEPAQGARIYAGLFARLFLD